MALTHLDAGVVIGLLDANDAHHAAARSALDNAVRNRDRLAMSASAYAEVLVTPARSASALRVVNELFERLPIDVVPIDGETTVIAARLRSAHRVLRLPDALVIASASHARAAHLITTDRRWPTARAMRIEMTITRL